MEILFRGLPDTTFEEDADMLEVSGIIFSVSMQKWDNSKNKIIDIGIHYFTIAISCILTFTVAIWMLLDLDIFQILNIHTGCCNESYELVV